MKDITWTSRKVRLEIASSDCTASIMVGVSTPELSSNELPKESLIAKTVVEACQDFVYSLTTEDITDAYNARSDIQYSVSHELGEELADSFVSSCEANNITVMLNSIKVVFFYLLPSPTFEISEATVDF